MSSKRLLIINPGSTSTKVAVFEDSNPIATETLRHSAEEISQYPAIMDQLEFRKNTILDFLKNANIAQETLSCVVGRGGTLPPMEGGVYVADDALIKALIDNNKGHASTLGGIIAKEIADSLNIPSFIVDSVTTDELDDIARYSGIPEIQRRSIFHALNQKAVARRAAAMLNTTYDEANFVVVHLGGGISIGAHKCGKVVEVNNALEGEGPYSPERSGGLPINAFVNLCFSGSVSYEEMKKKVVGKGGLVAYYGTNNLLDVEKACDAGDRDAKLYYEGMAYQVAKEVGKCATALSGKVDAILLTGGAARSKMLVEWIKSRVEFIANVMVFPGEDEMEALAEGGMRVLLGDEVAKYV